AAHAPTRTKPARPAARCRLGTPSTPPLAGLARPVKRWGRSESSPHCEPFLENWVRFRSEPHRCSIVAVPRAERSAARVGNSEKAEMRNTLLITAAAAALMAGTVLANAQGGAPGGAGASQSQMKQEPGAKQGQQGKMSPSAQAPSEQGKNSKQGQK